MTSIRAAGLQLGYRWVTGGLHSLNVKRAAVSTYSVEWRVSFTLTHQDPPSQVSPQLMQLFMYYYSRHSTHLGMYVSPMTTTMKPTHESVTYIHVQCG